MFYCCNLHPNLSVSDNSVLSSITIQDQYFKTSSENETAKICRPYCLKWATR
uniref:Uncharacterized protein n=1 Tax=Arion vulgaris TaxID=1028688 RepID=A0A0B7B322_9EUPU